MKPAPVLIALLLMVGAVALAEDSVWWEGENPIRTNFPGRTWFSPNENERGKLSAGDWLTNIDERTGEEAFALYDVTAPAAAEYDFWVRKFWRHGPFRWRFDDGEWRTCGRDIALADNVTLRTHVCANWVHLGKVQLGEGGHRFELRLLAGPGQNLTAGFDCFLLTSGAFVPRGKLKPGETSNLAEEGWFAFEPAPPAKDSMLDLRRLNEAEAGQSGYVTRDGDRFLLGNGREVRFWGVNISANNIEQNRASIDLMAKRLARLGVNAVRYHSPLFEEGGDPTVVGRERLDHIHYLVHAMRGEGIYTTLSFYFPLWFDVKPEHGIGGYETIGNRKPFALIFFEPRFQEIHRAWARALLTTTNPYTGRPLGREPAVAIVEIVNEDSLFFWTFSRGNMPEIHWRTLETLFGGWLARRHGGLKQAFAGWPGARHEKDDAAGGRAGLFDAWHMTRDGLRHGGGDKRRRMAEQVRFLTELQRGFYEETVAFWREELGVRSSISCSNWKTADPALLHALEQVTYSAGDVMDRHGYFGGGAEGEGASYSVREGHTYEDAPAVRRPDELPIQAVQLAGHPQIVSEIGWPNPNRFRADATVLAAAYGRLQGIDGFFWFAVGANSLVDSGMTKFPVGCPSMAWSFPATALLYRRGDIAQAGPVVRQRTTLDALFDLEGTGVAEAQAFDALRAPETRGAFIRRGGESNFDPLAFYVGPVVTEIGKESSALFHPEVAQRIDRRSRCVTSLTGSLEWDFGKGVMKLNTARAQGAAGFLGEADRIALRDVTINCENEFASALVVSLDDKPIAESDRVLVQCVTEEKPYGFTAQNGRITDLGGGPLQVKRIACSLSVRVAGEGFEVIALEPTGVKRDMAVTQRFDAPSGRLSFRLANDSIYHLILKGGD